MFSSATGNWSTPQDFYDKLNWRFGPFDLDPCASTHNTKCANFFTEVEDGLGKDWEGFTCFINPPYGRGIDKWIEKGYRESLKHHTKVVMLIPARTDTKYWHKYVMLASELYFVKLSKYMVLLRIPLQNQQRTVMLIRSLFRRLS